MKLDQKEISHGLPAVPSSFFVVHVRLIGIRYTYIIAGNDKDDAIERLKENARQVIEEVRSNCKPEDFLKMREATISAENEKRASELEASANRRNDELDSIAEKPVITEFDEARMETLGDLIVSERKEARKLREPVFVETESKFDRMTVRLARILSDQWEKTAERLRGDRAYPVSYFDDPRSIVSHCP